MLIQLVLGVMNLSVMILVAAVIAGEKLLAHGERLAKGVGVLAIVMGVFIAFRALL